MRRKNDGFGIIHLALEPVFVKKKVHGLYRMVELVIQQVVTWNQHNWIAKLLGYQFDINYRIDKENKAAHALSRLIDDGKLLAFSRALCLGTKNQQLEVEADLDLSKSILALQKDSNAFHSLHWIMDDCLLKSICDSFHFSLDYGVIITVPFYLSWWAFGCILNLRKICI